MAKKGPKFYAVRVGKQPGIYETWDECRPLVTGHPGSVYKSFPTYEEARSFLGDAVTKPKVVDSAVSAERRAGRAGAVSPSRVRHVEEDPEEDPFDEQPKDHPVAYYAVAEVQFPGVYTHISDVRSLTSNFSRGLCHRCDTLARAEQFLERHGVEFYQIEVEGRNRDSEASCTSEDVEPESTRGSLDRWGLSDSRSNSSEEASLSPPDQPGTPQQTLLAELQIPAPSSDFIPRATINGLSQQSSQLKGEEDVKPEEQKKGESLSPVPLNDIPLASQSYFDGIPHFKPDPSAPFDDEFRRLMASQGDSVRPQEYSRRRTQAVIREVRFLYSRPREDNIDSNSQSQEDDFEADSQSQEDGSDLSDLSSQDGENLCYAERLNIYQNMCREVDIYPPETCGECVVELKQKLVNIVDYIDAKRRGTRVKVWPPKDFEAFKKYTLRPGKRIHLEEAKANGGFLAALLQDFRTSDGYGSRKRMSNEITGEEPPKRPRCSL